MALCCAQVVVKAPTDLPTSSQDSSTEPAGRHSSHSSSWQFYRPAAVGYLPQHQHAYSLHDQEESQAASEEPGVPLQLLSPPPGTLLEADRTQQFAVLARSLAAVAVGSEQSGWVQLQPQQGAALAAKLARKQQPLHLGNAVCLRGA